MTFKTQKLFTAFIATFFIGSAAYAQTAGAEPMFEPHMKAEQKVVHPPFEWGDCTVCHTDAEGKEGRSHIGLGAFWLRIKKEA